MLGSSQALVHDLGKLAFQGALICKMWEMGQMWQRRSTGGMVKFLRQHFTECILGAMMHVTCTCPGGKVGLLQGHPSGSDVL